MQTIISAVDTPFPLSPGNLRPGNTLNVRAQAFDFTQAQSILIGLKQNFRFILTGALIVSEAITTLSAGATLTVQEVNPAAPQFAALTTAMTGTNNDVVLTALTAGTGGNATALTLVSPGTANAALSVSVTGQSITVNLATNGSSVITTTAAQLITALTGNAQAAALVGVALAASNDGTGVVTALSKTFLTGGLGWTVVQTLVASGALASSDAANKLQALTVSQGSTINGNNSLLVSVTAGSTATVDSKTVIFNLSAF